MADPNGFNVHVRSLEFALLSMHVYNVSGRANNVYILDTNGNRLSANIGNYTSVGISEDEITGFNAVAFSRGSDLVPSEERIIAFRGTDPKNLTSLVGNDGLNGWLIGLGR